MFSRGAREVRGQSERVNALDVARGLAIVCVIYGHALMPWFSDTHGHFSHAAFLQWKFGSAFMMPFFFFLSGVSWRNQRSLETTFRQALTLVLIALTASVALDFVRLLVSEAGFYGAPGWPHLQLREFAGTALREALFGNAYSMAALWFLTALAVVRVLAAVCFRAGKLTTCGVAVLLLIATLASTTFDWRNFYQLHLIGFAFVAFVIGYWARTAWRKLEGSPRIAWTVLIVAGAVTIATFNFNEGCRWDMASRCGLSWTNGLFAVSMIHGKFGNMFWFVFTGIAGVAFASALSVLAARSMAGGRLAIWGRASLDMLIVNGIFLELANPPVARWLAPEIAANNGLFFLVLFVVTLALNLVVTHFMSRPLRRLRGFASSGSDALVDFAKRPWRPAAVTEAADRVSQRNDERSA